MEITLNDMKILIADLFVETRILKQLLDTANQEIARLKKVSEDGEASPEVLKHSSNSKGPG